MCRGGGNEIEGEGEYFREILAFLVLSGLLFKCLKKVTVCLATHFYFIVFMPRPGSPTRQDVITQAAPPNCDGYS